MFEVDKHAAPGDQLRWVDCFVMVDEEAHLGPNDANKGCHSPFNYLARRAQQ